MVIKTIQQARQQINADVQEHCEDQGIAPCDSMYFEFARILLDVEDVAPAVAKALRREYGLQ